MAIHTFGHPHRWGHITEGNRKKLLHLSFGVFEEDFSRFKLHIQSQGIKLIDPPVGFESNGLWFQNPDGVIIELRVAEKSSPNEKSVFSMSSCRPGEQGAPTKSTASRIRPRRLAHVLLFTQDVGKSIEFYERVLGMRLSDRAGDGIAFMHGVHGSDHHMIALAKSSGPDLHHLSWDVGSVDDIGIGASHMADKGFADGWGMGRHVIGSNYFHYVRDPWGSYCEYSADIDYVPANCEWQARDNAPEDTFNIWGPRPPADFVINHEVG